MTAINPKVWQEAMTFWTNHIGRSGLTLPFIFYVQCRTQKLPVSDNIWTAFIESIKHDAPQGYVVYTTVCGGIREFIHRLHTEDSVRDKPLFPGSRWCSGYYHPDQAASTWNISDPEAWLAAIWKGIRDERKVSKTHSPRWSHVLPRPGTDERYLLDHVATRFSGR